MMRAYHYSGMAMERVPRLYSLGGMAWDSDLALPELPFAAPESDLPRLHLRVAQTPAELPGAIAIDPACWATPSEYLLEIKGLARYYAAHGREIVVEPEPGALPLDVRAYLLGTVFAVVCHQRGLLPLHGSAVSHNGRVTAFLARSGEGKSSLAASLGRRGFQVIADDICIVDGAASGSAEVIPQAAPQVAPQVIPSAPWLKLWRNTLEDLGERPEELQQVFSEDDKFRLPVASADRPQPLTNLVLLQRTSPAGGPPPAQSAPEIHPLAPVEAIPLLLNLTHQAYLVEAIGRRAECFRQCSRILSHAQAFRLTRPWDLAQMESTVDALEVFLRG